MCGEGSESDTGKSSSGYTLLLNPELTSLVNLPSQLTSETPECWGYGWAPEACMAYPRPLKTQTATRTFE